MNYDINLISNFIESDNFINFISDLFWRWQDEHEYEDINDYALPIESAFNTKFNTKEYTNAIMMTKRPFGFRCPIHNYTMKNGTVFDNAMLIFTIKSSGKIEWKVVGMP